MRERLRFIIPIVLLIAAHAFAQPQYTPIAQALKKGLIKLDITGKGGYTGEVILFTVKNLSAMDLNLYLEAGRRLDSKDSTEQDILVNRNEYFALKKGEIKSVNVSGMCCQAHNHSPQLKSVFSIGKLADSNLVRLARYINLKKYYGGIAAQTAVWVLSDKNPVESIYDIRDTASTTAMTKFVCDLLKKPYPNFRILYKHSGDMPCSHEPVHLVGDFSYTVPVDDTPVTIAIYDKDGEVVKWFAKGEKQPAGEIHTGYEFNVATLPHDKYFLRVKFGEKMVKEIILQF